MHVSLNEIETEVRKAARGCGLAWGLAEEAGKAARWLAARNTDILPAVADVLEAHLAGRLATDIVVSGAEWHGFDTPLSPFVAGPTMVDHVYLLADGGNIDIGVLAWPILLVPFAAAAARRLGAAVEIIETSSRCLVTPLGIDSAALAAQLAVEESARTHCVRSREKGATAPAAVSLTGAQVQTDAWDRLARLALKTYVPPSLVSRERGAGAGAIDND